MKPLQQRYVPSFTDFVVEFSSGEFRSSLKSLKGFDAGEVMVYLGRENVTRGAKAYTSVQCGRGPKDHIELNSDLVYINHSCEPNAFFDLSSSDISKWHLRALKRVEPGELLTFFYPSTEWDMDQPFKCECGTPSCLGSIQGARYLSRKELRARGYISPWILALTDERENERAGKLTSRL